VRPPSAANDGKYAELIRSQPDIERLGIDQGQVSCGLTAVSIRCCNARAKQPNAMGSWAEGRGSREWGRARSQVAKAYCLEDPYVGLAENYIP
jgi:hypothetical protein